MDRAHLCAKNFSATLASPFVQFLLARRTHNDRLLPTLPIPEHHRLKNTSVSPVSAKSVVSFLICRLLLK
jgi:hypothetical protein